MSERVQCACVVYVCVCVLGGGEGELYGLFFSVHLLRRDIFSRLHEYFFLHLPVCTNFIIFIFYYFSCINFSGDIILPPFLRSMQ